MHRAGVNQENILKVFLTTVRPVLEYPVPVWQSIPGYLSDVIESVQIRALKDGTYYCYCAYVLRISRYSDFLWPMLTNTGVFLRGLKLSGESRS